MYCLRIVPLYYLRSTCIESVDEILITITFLLTITYSTSLYTYIYYMKI